MGKFFPKEIEEKVEGLTSSLADIKTIKINVKDYGAKGDGITDDTQAITVAFNEVMNSNLTVPNFALGEDRYLPKRKVLYFPCGYYIYNGSGLVIPNGCSLVVEGDGDTATTIKIKNDTVLFSSSTLLKSLHIKGICFSGGKGVFNYNNTDSNIAAKYIIEENSFIGYTNTAIGSKSHDMPYWTIRNNYFRGGSSLTSIGLAMPGDCAGTSIENNYFTNNKVHIKLSDGGRGIILDGNDFVRYTRDRSHNVHDIWFVPTYGAGNRVSNRRQGIKCVLRANKFGGENVLEGDKRIIIANDAYSVADYDFFSSVTFDESNTAYDCIGVQVEQSNIFHNNYAGGATHNSPVYCAIKNLMDCIFELSVHGQDDSSPNYLVEFSPTVVNMYNANNVTSFGNMVATNILKAHVRFSSQTAIKQSNIPAYFITEDPFNVMTGDLSIPNYHQSGVDNTVKILGRQTSYNSFAIGGGATGVTATDSLGGTKAGVYTFTTSTTSYGSLYLGLTGFTRGKPVYIEFYASKHTVNSNPWNLY